MQKKFVFLLSFLLASMAHAELKVEDQQALVDYAKNLEAKVTKIVDNNLLYVGGGKYVVLGDFETITTNSDASKVTSPDLKALKVKPSSIFQVLGINPKDLISCPGDIKEVVYGVRNKLGKEFVGWVTDNYVTSVSYPSVLATANTPNNYYGVVSRVVTYDKDGYEVENFNLTVGFCKADLANAGRFPAIYAESDAEGIELNNLNGGVKFAFTQTSLKIGSKMRLGGQGVGLSFLTNKIFANQDFLNEVKAVFIDKTSTVASAAAKVEEQTQGGDDDFQKAFALFNAIYSSVKKQENTATNTAPAVTETKAEEPAKRTFTAEDQQKFGELVNKHFGSIVAQYFADSFNAINDGGKTTVGFY